MGGEGSMSQANQSLKLNRSMLRRKSFRDRKDLMRSFAGTTVVDFEELSPEEMLMIKEEIRAKARKERKKTDHCLFVFSSSNHHNYSLDLPVCLVFF